MLYENMLTIYRHIFSVVKDDVDGSCFLAGICYYITLLIVKLPITLDDLLLQLVNSFLFLNYEALVSL